MNFLEVNTYQFSLLKLLPVTPQKLQKDMDLLNLQIQMKLKEQLLKIMVLILWANQ
jgi:hypothetical protein